MHSRISVSGLDEESLSLYIIAISREMSLGSSSIGTKGSYNENSLFSHFVPEEFCKNCTFNFRISSLDSGGQGVL